MDIRAKASRNKSDEAFTAEGLIPGREGDVRKAIRLYEEAIAIDPRNVQAYHSLARIYLKDGEAKDVSRAEAYCSKGFAVTDIPPEISKPAIGVDDIRREWQDNFNQLMVYIRVAQGRHDESAEYLAKMKLFFDEYSKGGYLIAKKEFDNRYSGPSQSSSSATGRTGCALVLVCFLAATFVAATAVLTYQNKAGPEPKRAVTSLGAQTLSFSLRSVHKLPAAN